MINLSEQEKVKILQKFIQIPTENENEAKLSDYIASLFKGFNNVRTDFIEAAPNRKSVVITIKGTRSNEKAGKEKVLVLSGHEDTVAAGDHKKWDHQPFSGDIENGFLYGRGATDMKSGLAAMTCAVLSLAKDNFDFCGSIKLIGTVGEESSEIGAKQVTENGYIDDAAALIIGEPRKDFKIGYTNKGVIDYQVSAVGKSSHSSRPELGVNAIDAIRKAMDNFEKYFSELRKKRNEVLGSFTNAFTMISGGDQVNQIPAAASFSGNMRTIPETPNDLVIAHLSSIIEEMNKDYPFDLELKILFPELPLPVQPVSSFTELAQAAIKKVTGKNGDLVAGTGANEASEYIKSGKKFPILILGPEYEENAHQVNERIPVDIYLQAEKIYEEIIQRFFLIEK
ncbi:ArgE/DapE family deacylase [Oenococcus alcoholitolerans]|uniref:ArgE/DapE family deacylase n=1 Tax=Oenococcus alcoholitolerans TaxID=931074 RepID=UPI003F709390